MSSNIESPNVINIFFCYAHEDERFLKKIEKQLRILNRQWTVLNWHDRNIAAGKEWEQEIDTHLKSSQIILLLVSQDFIDSDYCFGIEMKQALERHNNGKARVIPIILRPARWENTPFSKLQVLPTGGKPVKSWPDEDAVYNDIASGIETNIKELLVSYKIKEGNDLYNDNQHEKALIAYDQAINIDPESASAFNNKGNALFALNRYPEAILAFEHAIILKPDFESALNGRDRTIRQLGDLKETQQQLEQQLQEAQERLGVQQLQTQQLETQLQETQEQLGVQQLQTQQFVLQLREVLQLETQLQEVLKPLAAKVQLEEEVVLQAQEPLSSLPSPLEKNLSTLSGQKGNKSAKLREKLTIDEKPDSATSGSLAPLTAVIKSYAQRQHKGGFMNGNEQRKQPTRNKKDPALFIIVLLVVVGLLFLSVLSYYARSTINKTYAIATANAYTTITARAHLVATANAYNTNTAKGIMFGFDPEHTHFNSYERVLNLKNVSSLVNYWTASTGGNINTSPVVANGMVYVGSDDGRLYAFNATGCGNSSCTPIWTASIGNSSINSSPAVASGVLYIGSNDHNLYAFNATGCGNPTCTPKWTASSGGNINTSPVVVDKIVYVGSNDHNLYAFNAAGCGNPSCTPIWTASTKGNINTSPAVANGMVYTGSDDGSLYAFNATGCGNPSCAPLWTASIGYSSSYYYGFSSINSSPAVTKNVLYIGSNNGKLYAFNATGCGNPSCMPIWTASTANPIHSSPTVANGIVYVGSVDHNLYAFNATGCGNTSCTPIWTASTSAPIDYSSPTVANGLVYIGSDDYKLYVYHLTVKVS